MFFKFSDFHRVYVIILNIMLICECMPICKYANISGDVRIMLLLYQKLHFYATIR